MQIFIKRDNKFTVIEVDETTTVADAIIAYALKNGMSDLEGIQNYLKRTQLTFNNRRLDFDVNLFTKDISEDCTIFMVPRALYNNDDLPESIVNKINWAIYENNPKQGVKPEPQDNIPQNPPEKLEQEEDVLPRDDKPVNNNAIKNIEIATLKKLQEELEQQQALAQRKSWGDLAPVVQLELEQVYPPLLLIIKNAIEQQGQIDGEELTKLLKIHDQIVFDTPFFYLHNPDYVINKVLRFLVDFALQKNIKVSEFKNTEDALQQGHSTETSVSMKALEELKPSQYIWLDDGITFLPLKDLINDMDIQVQKPERPLMRAYVPKPLGNKPYNHEYRELSSFEKEAVFAKLPLLKNLEEHGNKLIEERKNPQPSTGKKMSVIEALERLRKKLRAGGSTVTGKSEAGVAAILGISEFNEYWQKLDSQSQETLLKLKNVYLNFKKHLLGRICKEYAKDFDGDLPCVETTASYIDTFLKYNRQDFEKICTRGDGLRTATNQYNKT